MAEFPAPKEGIVLTHFIVSDNVERSRRFYTEVLGGESVRAGEPSFVALANSWIIINVGGGATDDNPTVTLEGAEFLTPPQDRGAETAAMSVIRMGTCSRSARPARRSSRR